MSGDYANATALLSPGSVCDAVERLLRGEDTQALCLVRPPGHHAMVNHAMGFCIFNNIAVAARLAVDVLELDRVLIVDWDMPAEKSSAYSKAATIPSSLAIASHCIWRKC